MGLVIPLVFISAQFSDFSAAQGAAAGASLQKSCRTDGRKSSIWYVALDRRQEKPASPKSPTGFQMNRKRGTCPLVQVRCTYQSRILAVHGGEMGIATDILSLRRDRLSSVTMLLSAIERFHEVRTFNRSFQVNEAADLVLTNVAAHAAEALVAQQPTGGRAQRVISIRRNRRVKASPSTLQRQLFVVRSAS